ncbi:MAG: bifunctional nuclease family protein [Candidatus Entotheonellia bacterium]
MHRMKIGMVVFDQSKGAAVITLVDETGKRAVPLLIGVPEALAIFRELNRYPSPRPTVYDLFKTVLDGLRVNVERVVIDTLREDTFYASVFMHVDRSVVVADARSSDAIALALKTQAPIYVEDEVLENAEAMGLTMTSQQEGGADDLQDWLSNVRPEDFGDGEDAEK